MSSGNTQSGSKPVNLALQGGGSHGAFTWGVLDRLLEEPSIKIDSISGTSAGAMNAVVLADGFARAEKDGRKAAAESARRQLDAFWRSVSRSAKSSLIQRSAINRFMGDWSMNSSWGYQVTESLTRLFSPYQFNPLNVNPLRRLLESTVDFSSANRCSGIQLFISATNVHTGRVKVFDRHQLSADVVMASACLPHLFQAVEIDGVPYWDGGYMGNPSLFPFRDHTDTADMIVVQINPIERVETPRTPQDIQNRLNEITFNSSLLKELRSIDFVSRMLDEGSLDASRYRRERVHIIENQEKLLPLGASSKLNAEWTFLLYLKEVGRKTADQWLEKNVEHIGEKSTVDLRSMFENTGPVEANANSQDVSDETPAETTHRL